MSDTRPLLACECVECPSHRAERERREAHIAALTAALAQIAREVPSLGWASLIAHDALDAAAGGA